MMFCFLYKHAISRSMDSGKPLGRLASRHVARCRACGQFQDQCLTLARELANDARDVTANVSADLHARILERCERMGGPASDKAADAGTAFALPCALARGRAFARDARRLLLRPAVYVAAAAAIVLLAVLAWHFYAKSRIAPGPKAPPIVDKHKTEPPGLPPRELVPDLPTPSGPLAAIDQALGQSVQEELRLLQEDGKAAAEFLLACVPLEIKLPEK